MRHPEALIDALRDSAVKDLTVISNNAGVDGFGLGKLLETRQIKKMISSYVGENKEFGAPVPCRRAGAGIHPRARWPKKRAGGAGIPAFFTKTGVGTIVAEGKELREFDGETYVMERSLVPDVAGQGLACRQGGQPAVPPDGAQLQPCGGDGWQAVHRRSGRGRWATGAMAPDQIHLPGIYAHRIVHNPPEKRIEKRTITEKAGV